MNITDKFVHISQFLQKHHAIWSENPFYNKTLSWESSLPSISTYLRKLPPEFIEQFELDPLNLPNKPPRLERIFSTLQKLAWLDSHPHTETPFHPFDKKKIKQRKFQQIHAFATRASKQVTPTHGIVDWCSGKGHLGRMLGKWYSKSVTAFELQQKLCLQGQRLANAAGVQIHFQQADLLVEKPTLPKNQCVVGLHACGDLTDKAIETVILNEASLAISPCCYHSIKTTEYLPKSNLGQKWNLHLDKKQLRLPSAFEVVATEKQKQERRQEIVYRLGFDWLLQKHTGTKEYTSFPPVQTKLISGSFVNFCTAMMKRHNITLPSFDPDTAQKEGHQKAQLFRSLSMIRTPFRRLIEVWLVLDKALWLKDNGWECQVATFCQQSLTPRNILIVATPSKMPHKIPICND